MTKAVVITGASAGIGRTTAELIAQKDYAVVNLDRAPSDAAGVHTIQVDLTDFQALEAMLRQVAADFEVVGLVNNAGFAQTALLGETSADLLQRTFQLNLSAAALCARALLPAMKARRYGRIVNVSSRSALGRELRTAYAASKGGLISMTRVWALELAAFGITSNCVAPGPISTDLFDDMNPNGSERRDRMIREIPVGRIGEPHDVAHAVNFFLSPNSGYINGQTLYVCGGLSVGVAPL